MNNNYQQRYLDLCDRFRVQAQNDGDIYLPNLEIRRHVDIIFISMEPSLGRWANGRTPDEKRASAFNKINSGFRNFIDAYENHIFHYCARNYFCQPNETYHLTDISKGAMLGKNAAIDRRERYIRWYDLLLEEIRLISNTGVRIYAVGGWVADFLNQKGFLNLTGKLLHFSSQASRFRPVVANNFPDEYRQFESTVTHENIMQTAKTVLNENGVNEELRLMILNRLSTQTLSESRKKLMFTYKKIANEEVL